MLLEKTNFAYSLAQIEFFIKLIKLSKFPLKLDCLINFLISLICPFENLNKFNFVFL